MNSESFISIFLHEFGKPAIVRPEKKKGKKRDHFVITEDRNSTYMQQHVRFTYAVKPHFDATLETRTTLPSRVAKSTGFLSMSKAFN